MKKQNLFTLITDYDLDKNLRKLRKLIAKGWFIKLATPYISNGSTRSIIYVLEKEELEDEKIE